MPYREDSAPREMSIEHSKSRSRNISEKSDDIEWAIHNNTDSKYRKFTTFSNNRNQENQN